MNCGVLAFFGLSFGGLAIFFAQLDVAFALAGVLAFASVLGSLAVGLALASVHAFTVHFAFCRNGAADTGSNKHAGRSNSQSNTCEFFNSSHGLSLLKLQKPVFKSGRQAGLSIMRPGCALMNSED
ncbi:MAG TPA: hypothetical protein VLL03_00520 [Burkholderiales bacterium]|nr:hypothetical protein [Burkholderiales bacterium]